MALFSFFLCLCLKMSLMNNKKKKKKKVLRVTIIDMLPYCHNVANLSAALTAAKWFGFYVIYRFDATEIVQLHVI